MPRHLEQLSETLVGSAALTIVSDRNRGGYDRIIEAGTHHIEIDGMRSCLRPGTMWRGWRGALRVARSQNWDVIWLHARLPALMLRMALALRLLRPSPQTRIAMTYHGIPFDPGHRRLAAVVSRWLERFLLAHCPPMHLVFVSSDMAIRLRNVVGETRMMRHITHVLPNSSNLGKLPLPRHGRNQRQLVITGRAGYQKNYPLAVRLMDHMPPEYSLTLCGSGTDDPTFQARILRQVRPETRARVHFTGSLADVRPILAEADGYLLTSRYEGMPIGTIEAFECGLPIILGPIEAAPEIIATHPMAMCLPLRDLPRDAVRITQLIESYVSTRSDSAARIRAAWRRSYPYDIWQFRARRLVSEVLGSFRTDAERQKPAP
ncbi:glycosyltransferase family 4 protein [Roseovarius pelagicus]|uniref:Glycosyltransferase family 4 protein n=1 Tax=Roseovarius pelagicus TaxID=2980108 RepID=A0ABY6D6Q7_9RHOB|nr:glycosyltransferase family 4 protein [Roseovarius pelagicus]UXX81820.1 glycosyltransferase family 4 protein [Roseovarius pelagicus]